jgi:hypothetical protein
MPTPASLFAGLLFASIGAGAFLYGKRQAQLRIMLSGIALIVLPYVIDDARWLYAAGGAVCASLYWFRR